MLRGNRRLHSTPRGGNRLDGGDHGPNDGVEDSILSREMVFSLPELGNGRTLTPRFTVFLRRKRLLSRWASHLGALPGGLPNRKAALYHRGLGLRTGVLLGFSAPHATPSFPRTDGLPPPRADGQAQGHPQILGEIPTGG